MIAGGGNISRKGDGNNQGSDSCSDGNVGGDDSNSADAAHLSQHSGPSPIAQQLHAGR